MIRWFDYCTRRNIDPFQSNVNQGAEFWHNTFMRVLVTQWLIQPDQLFPTKYGNPLVSTPLLSGC